MKKQRKFQLGIKKKHRFFNVNLRQVNMYLPYIISLMQQEK